MEGSQSSTRRRLQHGIVLFPLLIFVRNSFTPVPFQILTGLITYKLALLIANQQKAR
jgi:hypothetical protein